MTRRVFLLTPAAAAGPSRGAARLTIPVHRMMDAHTPCPPDRVRHFWGAVWPEAYRMFSQSGMDLQTSDSTGAVKRSAADRPMFEGLRRDVLNLVLTAHIPMFWDRARALPGITTIYDGYHICMIALRFAHGNQAPFLSTNTCVHEMLHALMGDILVRRPSDRQIFQREVRVDWYATRLWLFHDGAVVRRSARAYLKSLRAMQGGA